MDFTSKIDDRLAREERRLGPAPRPTLATMVDLGMTDDRIGRYFGMDADLVASLRMKYSVERPLLHS